jgi:dihydrofolate reductase
LPLQKEGTTVVLTSDEQMKSVNPTVVFTRSSPADIAAMLEEKGHTEAVIIGGTLTMSAFINAGLVDDIYFVMEPVLFAGGLPLINRVGFDLKMQLLDVKQLNDNTVQLHYAIKK